MDETQIRLALPSKGRMEGETLAFLAECGLRVNKTNARQYTASMPALPEVQVLFQRARDIVTSVQAGDVDLGITGMDIIAEKAGDDPDDLLVIHDALGFGACALALAVPVEWGGVRSVDDLRDYATKNSGLRVATKHERLAAEFLAANAVEGCRVVASDGALEAAPSVGSADFIADITSTGTTLRDNHLKQIEGGTILTSQATLFGNRAALGDRPELLATTRRLLEYFEAHLRAEGQYMIWANVRAGSAEGLAAFIFEQTDLGGLQGPTIAPVYTRDGGGNGWYAVNVVVSARRMYSAVEQMRAIGGSGVVVSPVTYIFEERPARDVALVAQLGLGEEVTT